MRAKITEILGGTAVGILNGLFGGGGGMVAVPVLKAAGRSPKNAHATAIAVILPASAANGAVYLANGFVPFPLLLPVAVGVLLGGILGAKLLARLSGRTVTFLFALAMLAAGLAVLIK